MEQLVSETDRACLQYQETEEKKDKIGSFDWHTGRSSMAAYVLSQLLKAARDKNWTVDYQRDNKD